MSTINKSELVTNGQLDVDKLREVMDGLLGAAKKAAKTRTQTVSLSVSVGSTPESPYPIILRLANAKTPDSVSVSKVVQQDGGASVLGSGIDWEPHKDGIRIKYISGLDADRKYTVTLLISQ